MGLYRWLISVLVWLSADPAAVELERPKAAAAVAFARATMISESSPTPAPEPKPFEKCCGECKGTGYITMPDGHRVKCPCPDDCPCRKAGGKKADCPDGTCPEKK